MKRKIAALMRGQNPAGLLPVGRLALKPPRFAQRCLLRRAEGSPPYRNGRRPLKIGYRNFVPVILL